MRGWAHGFAAGVGVGLVGALMLGVTIGVWLASHEHVAADARWTASTAEVIWWCNVSNQARAARLEVEWAMLGPARGAVQWIAGERLTHTD